MQMIARIVAGTLLVTIAVVVTLFSIQNTQPVNVEFLSFASGGIPLAFVILGSAVAGGVIFWLLSLWGVIRRSMKHRRELRQLNEAQQLAKKLEERVAALEAENSTLRKQVPAAAPVSPTAPPATSKTTPLQQRQAGR